ncbi:MAG: Gfo/Idh/MocA family oxidoreductase [Elusimicrobia bacterium]|nr:Gfo/Idh/MocA family oxidoreductase [Elusimicrobiota bacterium]
MDPIKLSVIGHGRWGQNLVRCFRDDPNSSIVSISDLNPARLHPVRERFPEIETSTDPLATLKDERVRAVAIATPCASHFVLAEEALKRGKDVFLEKPMASRLDHALELCALAEKNGCILMVGHVYLFNEAVRAVKRSIETGLIGRVRYLTMTRAQLGPVREDVNAAWDLAAHDISIADYWLGHGALSASATGGPRLREGREDAVFAALRYPGDILVNIQSSWITPRKMREATAVGTEKTLAFDDQNVEEPVRIYDDRGRISSAGLKIAPAEPLAAECRHFIESVRSRRAPISGGREGTAVVRTLEAISRSLGNNGREEKVG